MKRTFAERLTAYIEKRGLKVSFILEQSGISRWKLDGYRSGRIKPEPWEQYGFMAFLETIGKTEGDDE